MTSKMKQILASSTAPAIVHMSAYANTLTPIIGDIYAAMDTVSRELTGFIPGAMRATGVERAAVGQTVEYPIAPVQDLVDIVPSMTIPEPGDNAFETGLMSITKSKAAEFGFTGEEQRALNSAGPGMLSAQAMIIAQGIRTLANAVEADGAVEAAAGASRAIGTAGTTPFATDSLGELAQLRKILDDNGAPASMRSAVLNTSAGANLRSVKNLTRVNESGTQMGLRDGELLDVFGFSVRETGQPVTHTAGTGAGATTDATGYARNATVITLAGAGTGTIVPGDVVSFAGDANKYLVVAGDTNVADGGTITLALPGLREAIPAQATAVAVTNNYAANVGFSMDALHVAMRPPARPTGGDQATDVQLITDPRTGISFEFAVYPGYRKMRGEIGLAWGWKATKAEHIALLLG